MQTSSLVQRRQQSRASVGEGSYFLASEVMALKPKAVDRQSYDAHAYQQPRGERRGLASDHISLVYIQ
jgi:hypothetical protein